MYSLPGCRDISVVLVKIGRNSRASGSNSRISSFDFVKQRVDIYVVENTPTLGRKSFEIFKRAKRSKLRDS